MSDLILGTLALEWAHLEGFAGERLRGKAFAFVGDPREEAARYLRYSHGMTVQEWALVETFRLDHADELTIKRQRRFVTGTSSGSVAPSDVPEYDASSVATQFRSLFGFAAQYTVLASDLVEEYLREFHGLGVAEWLAIDDFLMTQEGHEL